MADPQGAAPLSPYLNVIVKTANFSGAIRTYDRNFTEKIKNTSGNI